MKVSIGWCHGALDTISELFGKKFSPKNVAFITMKIVKIGRPVLLKEFLNTSK